MARRVRCLPVLAAAAFLLILLPNSVYAESNADNYFCRACGVVMEHMHRTLTAETEKLRARVTAGSTESVKIDTPSMARALCDDNTFKKKHDDFIVEGCKEIVDKNADLLADIFAGEPPTPSTTYARTVDACITKMNLCDERTLPTKPLDRCEACLAVVQDIHDVVLRRKGKRSYKTRKHIGDLLDEECTDIALRHPPAIVPSMQEACEDLVSDFEKQVIQSFTYTGPAHDPARMLCGSGGLGVCKGRKGVWTGVRSPFAYVPEHAKEEHDEL
jgi:hypothetical protein